MNEPFPPPLEPLPPYEREVFFDDYNETEAPLYGRSPSDARFHANMNTEFLLRQTFFQTVPDTFGLTVNKNFNIESSGIAFVEAIVAMVREISGAEPLVRGLYHSLYSIEVVGTLQAIISMQMQRGDITTVDRNHFTVEIAGGREAVLRLCDSLRDRFGETGLATTSWWYQSGASMGCQHVVMDDPPPIYDEFYPFLGEPVESFLDSYLDDQASILFLMGDPGTGKTSLIRHMICSRKLNAMMTYDESLLDRDNFFLNWLCNPSCDVLVIEDAETILGSREGEGNKLVARFLNVSDGLIRMKKKKLIFTNNLTDFSRVDHALIRQGRCFGAVKFRSLTSAEANAAAIAAGLPAPDDRSMTLAELFPKKGSGSHKAPEIRTIGF